MPAKVAAFGGEFVVSAQSAAHAASLSAATTGSWPLKHREQYSVAVVTKITSANATRWSRSSRWGPQAAAGAPLRNRHINAGWLLLLIVWQGCYSLLSHIIGAAAKKYNGDCAL